MRLPLGFALLPFFREVLDFASVMAELHAHRVELVELFLQNTEVRSESGFGMDWVRIQVSIVLAEIIPVLWV